MLRFRGHSAFDPGTKGLLKPATFTNAMLVCTGMIITEGTLLLKRSLSPRHWSHANLRNQALPLT